MLVVTLIATALAVLLPRWHLAGQSGLREQAQALQAALQAAKLQAIATGQTQNFIWQPATRAWTMGKQHGQIASDIQVSMTYGQHATAERAAATIRFFPNGLSSGGRLRLLRGNGQAQLDVDWLSAEVQYSEKSQ
jgi:general secretion pathway protein H